MLQIERILCPIDFSEFSVTAYDYAQSLAWHYKATLFLQYVIDSLTPYYPYFAYPDPYHELCRKLRADAEHQLQEFAKKHSWRGIEPHCSVQDGEATDLILGLAEAQEVNLIVMGTHGLGGIDHLALGSVTEKVLRKARCPVLAVRKPAHAFTPPRRRAGPCPATPDTLLHRFFRSFRASLGPCHLPGSRVRCRTHRASRVGRPPKFSRY